MTQRTPTPQIAEDKGQHIGSSNDSERTVAAPVGEQPIPAVNAVDQPPDGGYGWVCVACCFWINAHTWGINSVSVTASTCQKQTLLRKGISVVWCISGSLHRNYRLSWGDLS